MGTVNYTIYNMGPGNGIGVLWASMSTGSGSSDTGQAFPSSLDYALGSMLFSDKSIHAFDKTTGTVDTQILIEGSNEMSQVDPTALTYATLSDAQGNALLFAPTTSPRLEQVLENCVFLRPRVTTISSTSMGMDVWMLITSNRSARGGM